MQSNHMKTFRPRSIKDLHLQQITKGEAFAEFPDTFDYALPQQWLDYFAEWCEGHHPNVTYHLILSSTVWAYSDGTPFGEPVTVCREVAEAYAKLPETSAEW